MKKQKYIRRFTDLPALMYLLQEQKLTLLNPVSWDDRNDREFMAIYQRKKKLKTLLALCFSLADEAYHHWKVFAPGPAGVCIRFHMPHLVYALVKRRNVKARRVRYMTIKEGKKLPLAVDRLPFVKRRAYMHEVEYRAIYESKALNLGTMDLDVPLSAIDRITLSPWLPYSVFLRVKKILQTIPECDQIPIVRSTLVHSEQWMELGVSAENLAGGSLVRPQGGR